MASLLNTRRVQLTVRKIPFYNKYNKFRKSPSQDVYAPFSKDFAVSINYLSLIQLQNGHELEEINVFFRFYTIHIVLV